MSSEHSKHSIGGSHHILHEKTKKIGAKSISSKADLPRSMWVTNTSSLGHQPQPTRMLTDKRTMNDESIRERNDHDESRPSRATPYLTFTIGLLLGTLGTAIALAFYFTTPKTTTTSTTSTSTSTSTTVTTTTSQTTTTTTTTSTSKTTTTTTIILPGVNALWSFDGHTLDTYGRYDAVSQNGPTYVTGINGQSGTALAIDQSASQYVVISSSFVDLTYKSFTVEMWFYPTALTELDTGLFSQCETPVLDRCLIFMIRHYRLLMAFYADDTYGSTNICINHWYHVAFVYDYASSTQSIYLDGVLELTEASNAYQGTVGDIHMGAINTGTLSGFFTGYLDQVSLVTRAKTAAEVLIEATLVCYFPFDSSIYANLGPLSLWATGSGVSLANNAGRINSAASFASASTYLVVGGLTRLGTVGQAYSISFWIKPTSISGGTIVHGSKCNPNCTSNWCLPLIGLTSSGKLVAQSWSSRQSHLMTLTGPILSTNIWTHIVQTYSSTNGMRLFINGDLYNQSTTFLFRAAGAPIHLFLGSYPSAPCVVTGTIRQGQYYGLLDEFYLFARDLTPAEVYELANP